MSRTVPITAEDVDAELQRMRRENEQAREENERLKAEINERLKALEDRPQSPHALAIREFEEDHQRRYEAGRKVEAERLAAEERTLDERVASRSWVRVTCANQNCQQISWHETVEETSGLSERRAYLAPAENGPTAEWVAQMIQVERTMSLAGGGHMLEVATEFTRRIVNNPELAMLVEKGTLIVTPLTPDENRDQERRLLRTRALPPTGWIEPPTIFQGY